MTAEHLNHLPNVAAMLILIATLLILQRRQPRLTIGSWMLALTLILSSQISWFLARDSGPWQVGVHTFRLCVDLSAGVVFLLFTGRQLASTPQRVLFLLWNTIAFLALEMLYGANLYRPVPYLICAAAGISISVVVSIVLKRKWTIPAAQIAIWTVIAACAAAGSYRSAAYFGLGSIYAAAAWNLWTKLRRGTIGRLVIVASLAIWAVTYLLHPWIYTYHPLYREVADEIWGLQKFFVAIGMLITLLEDESLENERLAMKDQLTGLANRRWMEQRLIAAVERGRVGIVLLDLDDFKEVNDSLGHLAGDELLCHIASRLGKLVTEEETLTRLGGDEFLIISTRDVKALASLVKAALQEPILVDGGHLIHAHASFGTSSFPEDAAGTTGTEAVKHLLRTADRRMYAYKHSPQRP